MFCTTGIVRAADFLEMTESQFDEVVDVNLKGVFLTCQAAAKQMVAQGRGGAIITMSSVNAVMAIPTIAGYNASKGGVNSLTRCAGSNACCARRGGGEVISPFTLHALSIAAEVAGARYAAVSAIR